MQLRTEYNNLKRIQMSIKLWISVIILEHKIRRQRKTKRRLWSNIFEYCKTYLPEINNLLQKTSHIVQFVDACRTPRINCASNYLIYKGKQLNALYQYEPNGKQNFLIHIFITYSKPTDLFSYNDNWLGSKLELKFLESHSDLLNILDLLTVERQKQPGLEMKGIKKGKATIFSSICLI